MKHNFNMLNIIAILFLVSAILSPGRAPAETENELPTVTGTIIRNDARITFEWPKPVKFVAKAEGKTVRVTFEREVNPDFGSLLSSLYPYVKSAQTLSNGKTIVMSLEKPYKIRTFLTDNIGGIDLIGIDPAERAAFKNETISPSAPKAPEAQPGQSPPAPALATPSSTEPVQTAGAPEIPKAPHDDSAKSGESDIQAYLKINVSAAKDSAVLRLPFIQRAAIAVFIRDNYLWVVLDKAYTLDLSDFDSLQKTVIGKAEVVEAKQSVLRIPIDDNIFASVAKEEASFEWAILLTPANHTPLHPLSLDVNTDPPTPPNVFIKSLQMADPITITDLLIGDELIVTPLYMLGEAVSVAREFVEFGALETAQGIAIVKKADNVEVTALRNGLRIATPQGAILTPGLPPLAAEKGTSFETVATFFPFEKWHLSNDVPQRKQMQSLFQSIVENENHREANEQRIKLAQIYLSEGLASEAMGILGEINRTDPIFYRSAKLSALHGAANFLMYRFSEASRDFAASELNNNKEIEFWRNMLADLLGTPNAYDYLRMEPDYISKYPPLFRQRIAIVAANKAIDDKNYNAALKIFDTLQPNAETKQEDLTAPIKPYINYLFAKISTETGQTDEGVNTWDELSQDYSNPFIQTHAEFSKIIWDMNHGTLDKNHAIEKLESLRLNWHGDSMELKILDLLGNLYNEKKDYINAMRVWDGGVSSFPSTPTAIEMAHKMRETFSLMFSEEATINLSPMDELVLFYQYRNYAPPAGADRDITDRLADRLVAIDLLEQAATLLDHEMRVEVNKQQRSRVGAKMASIYLLAHKPQKALNALQDSVYGEIPSVLRLERNRIAAEALFEINQPEKAKQIIAHDESLDAERIRLNIYWEQKDWPDLITTAEGMLKLRKDVSAPLNLEDSDAVLKLALAYVFQNEPLQLQYLHDYFGPLMANNPNKPVFDFITASDITLSPTNFNEVIKNLSATRTFLQNYHARVQILGISAGGHTPTAATTAGAGIPAPFPISTPSAPVNAAPAK